MRQKARKEAGNGSHTATVKKLGRRLAIEDFLRSVNRWSGLATRCQVKIVTKDANPKLPLYCLLINTT